MAESPVINLALAREGKEFFVLDSSSSSGKDDSSQSSTAEDVLLLTRFQHKLLESKQCVDRGMHCTHTCAAKQHEEDILKSNEEFPCDAMPCAGRGRGSDDQYRSGRCTKEHARMQGEMPKGVQMWEMKITMNHNYLHQKLEVQLRLLKCCLRD